MTKVFLLMMMIFLSFIGYKVYDTRGTCLEEVAINMATCKPIKCSLDKHPYAKTEDIARIYGFSKAGECVYKVDTGNIRTTCRFPKSLLGKLAAEIDQKVRVKEFGPVRKTRKEVRMHPKTGKREGYDEILLQGKWEEYHHNLSDAIKNETCIAFNRKTKVRIK